MKKYFTILSFCFISLFLNTPGFASPPIFHVGEIQIEMLVDELGDGDASILRGASPQTIQEYIPSGKFPLTVASSLIRTPEQLILVDTGIEANKLGQHLSSRHIAPDDLRIVLLTHMHFDHIGGLMHEGKAFFPNATLYISERELAYWSDTTNISTYPEEDQPAMRQHFENVQSMLNAYQDRVATFSPAELAENGTEILPGVNAIAAYGHTPGHTVFLLHNQNNKLLLLGDTFHVSKIQFPHPEVTLIFDVDQQQAAQTRHTLFAFAADNAIPVAGMHQGSPEYGLIKRLPEKDEGYMLEPIQ